MQTDLLEGWWLVVGSLSNNLLYTIKYITVSGNMKTKLEMEAPSITGLYDICIYLISDAYFGCDQECYFKLNVT